MKRTFIGICLAFTALVAVFLLPPSAREAKAQSLNPNWVIGSLSLTNQVGTNDNITVNLGSAVQMFNGPTIVEFQFSSVSASHSGAVALTFVRSLDNSVWETNPGFMLTGTGNGTNLVVVRTNFAPGVINSSWVKLSRLNNAASAYGITNLVVRIASAPLAP